MAQATANFELGSNGSDILAVDPGSATAWDAVTNGSGTNILKYNNTHAYGSLAAKVDGTVAGGSQLTMDWTTGIGTLTDWYGRLYLYATTNPSTSLRICRDINNNFPVFVDSSGLVSMLDQGGFAVTTSTAISLNQWVRIEWHWLNSGTVGQVELKLFNSPDSVVPTETQTSAANRNTSVSTTELDFGINPGGSAELIWLDNIVAGATSYPGPVTVPSTAPQVLSMQSHVFGHGVW